MALVRQVKGEYIYSSIYRGERPPPDVSIYDFMFKRRESGNYPPSGSADRVALIDDATGRRVSFKQLQQRIDDLAAGLKARCDIQIGDVVCVFSSNHIDYPTCIWALLKLAAIVSGANPQFTEHELASQLRISGAKWIITQQASLAVALKAAKMLRMSLSNIIVLEPVEIQRLQFISIDELVEYGRLKPITQAAEVTPSSIALLAFSSGTSGLPKGVKISHANVVTNVCQLYEMEKHDKYQKFDDNICCAFLPFYHSNMNEA